MTEKSLVSQSLTFVRNWKQIVKDLDIRNAIMWYLADFIHKNSNVDANRIRALVKDEDTVRKLIEALYSSDEKLKERINEILEDLQDEMLKDRVKEILKTNDKFKIDIEHRTVNHLNPSRKIKDEKGYIPIYNLPGSSSSRDTIHIKMITLKDLKKPIENEIFNSKRIKLWMIKRTNSESKYEAYVTMIASILFNSRYKIRESNIGKKVIVEFIPNILKDAIAAIDDAKDLNEKSLIKTIVTNLIIGNNDDHLGNILIDVTKKVIPIDFDITYIIRFDLKSYLELLDNKMLKDFPKNKSIIRCIMICEYLMGKLSYKDLALELVEVIYRWGFKEDYNFILTEKEFDTILLEVLSREKFKLINDIKINFLKDSNNDNSEEEKKILSLFKNIETFYDLLQKHIAQSTVQPSASMSAINDPNTNTIERT